MHIHRDPDWQVRGVWAYYECRCGARRVRRYAIRLMGPSDPSWPLTRNRHGQSVDDTGWVREPEGGWPRMREKPLPPHMAPPLPPAPPSRRTASL